ncbi:MAG: tRNA 4-thiouridine(8) synthase ThiI [Candidatus Marinimicrobia bacterium]|nr:tRNA 4-thiouridine(8) synthase ThiI [Candidatus Neomarinimicrobiota bacterium]MBL7023158.1 tRNA 4-thiouridine(8) synthase ThiI [Candidatus Neomarinimicrobiota bacterium]MBL7109034.1 tRNA 4-thiouridine(8) synthase ThiI [Candidatus Neomarinimicrobiota bacterium]
MQNSYCILVHYHEISIKGGNRAWFEKTFQRNLKKHISDLPYTSINTANARVFVFGIDELRWDEYAERLKCVMGLMNATLMTQIPAEIEKIRELSAELIKDENFSSFRVSAKRQYKNYPLTSTEINIDVGAHIQSIYKKPVKLKGADLNIIIEIVKGMAYVGVDKIVGYGGLPVGTGEKAVSLLSSGIDSPVSSFEMLKRGVNLVYVHFHSAPATSRQSLRNVEELLLTLAKYQLRCELYHIPLLEIQQKIMAEAPNKFWVLLFRRAMVRLAEHIADSIGAVALITGENIGQVASQTLSNIRATSDAVEIPIIRPLAGHNKEDIINRAIKIGTYETSIEPYQDCCSFFVPKHPETKANLEEIRQIEAKIELEPLLQFAIENSEKQIIKFDPTTKVKIKSTKIQTKKLVL